MNILGIDWANSLITITGFDISTPGLGLKKIFGLESYGN